MWKWIVSPRRAAERWVVGIVNREFFAPRRIEAEAVAAQIEAMFLALQSAQIRIEAAPDEGQGASKSVP